MEPVQALFLDLDETLLDGSQFRVCQPHLLRDRQSSPRS